MTRLYCICVALLIALLLAISAATIGPSALAQDASPVASPTSDCGRAAPVASPVPETASTVAEPTLLMSPERLVWVGGPHAVVLLHQINLDMRSWVPQAEAINAAGYTVVAIENAGPNGLQMAIADLRARCGAETVTIIAASIGGQTSETVIRTDPAAFDQIIFLSCIVDTSRFGEMPKLFVASEGEGESYDPAAFAEASAGDDNTAVSYAGTAHAQEIFLTESGPDLLARILAWLAEHS